MWFESTSVKNQTTPKLLCASHKQPGSIQPETDLANSRKDLDVWQWKLTLLQDNPVWSQKKTEAPNYLSAICTYVRGSFNSKGKKKSPRNLQTEQMKASALSDMVNEVSLVLKKETKN